jgi:hypothetical protein
MFDSIKLHLFTVTGVIITIIHVTFVLGALQMGAHAVAAWHGETIDPVAVPKRK